MNNYEIDSMIEASATRYMRVLLKTSDWRPTKEDKAWTEQVESAAGTEGVYKTRKSLAPKKSSYYLAQTQKALRALREYVTTNTVVGRRDGERWLLATRYFEFSQEAARRLTEFECSVATLSANWADELARYQAAMGYNFIRAEYPDDPATKFSAALDFEPVPTLDALPPGTAGSLRQHMAECMAKHTQAINADLTDRLLKPVQALAAKLEEYKGEKGQAFHASLVDNIHQSLAIVRGLDPSPEVLTKLELIEQAMDGITPEGIKSTDLARQQAKAAVDDILGAFGM